MKKLLQSYFQRIPKESRVAIAVSGGVDSVVLLHEVVSYCRSWEKNRELFVLHLNHNTRGRENDVEQEFVHRLCKRLQIPCISEKIPKAVKATQSSLRKKRKIFFQKHLGPKDFLFLAHNEDDQAETILFRIIRGVGIRGLKGMKDFDPPLVRPFLQVSRQEILHQAKKLNCEWMEDSSNASTKYERNWIRLELIPLLDRRKPGIRKRLAALANEAAKIPVSPLPKPVFRSENGWALYSLASKRWQNTEILSRLFLFDRNMANRMKDQIAKGSGKILIRNEVFWISHGYLLKNAEHWTPGRVEDGYYHSVFGSWLMTEDLVTQKGYLGEKAKKIFQEKKVPVFFRDSLPFQRKEGRWGLHLKPDSLTEFGRWFMETFESHHNRVDFVSKEKSPLQQSKELLLK